MQIEVSYSEPKLCDCKGDLSKNWFVYFEIENLFTGEKKRLQFRQGINHYKKREQRYKYAAQVIAHWKKDLKNGWHPWDDSEVQFFYFPDAIKHALENCEVATKTKSCYQTTVNYITKAAKALSYDKWDVTKIERKHIREMLAYGRKEFKWSNNRYNKSIGYLSAVLSRLEDEEIIKFNPANKIKSLPVAETEGFLPFTADERDKIRECLFFQHYRFYVVLMVEVHTGIRPKEILALKIKDVDLLNGIITIIPDLKAENSKTKKIRRVPIPNELAPFLRELKLNEHDRNNYVFGSPFKPGEGNRGKSKFGFQGSTHPDYLAPSFTLVKRDTITKLWNKLIIKGLGIDKKLYGGKKTGANLKILAGVSLDALQRLYGHHSKMMTERYAREVNQVYFKELKEISPTF